jgi:hypothetical protein
MHSPLSFVIPVWACTGLMTSTSIIYAPYFPVLVLSFDSLTLKTETLWFFKLLGSTCAVTQFYIPDLNIFMKIPQIAVPGSDVVYLCGVWYCYLDHSKIWLPEVNKWHCSLT